MTTTIAPVTSDQVQAGVDFALRIAHAQMNNLGRQLHPTEVRWVVRWAFRTHYPEMSMLAANLYADQMMEVIRVYTDGAPTDANQ